MKKKLTRALSLSLAVLCLLGCLSGCGGGGGGASSDTTFSWWMAKAENAEFYTDYDENPVIKYITASKTFENKDGEQVHIGFDFQSGVTGSEQDNFNNMMASKTYTDVIDPVYYAGSIVDLYKEGTILDMTDYVTQYMPNYMKWIEGHPEFAQYMTTNVDGEEKYLRLPATVENIDMYDHWYGYAYRRDWIVKYDVQPDQFFDPRTNSAPQANPNAGKAFSGSYTLDNDGNTISEAMCGPNVNGDSWVDDVVFPSGHPDPIYITDWEWMLDIFAKAMEAEGITDGYGLSLYYPGYLEVGDLVSGFGGIGPTWYLDADGKCQFGAVSDGFKAYMECMNQWYQNGWLDKRFAERSSDAFYFIDNTTVRQGKVGMWLATPSELMSRIQNETLAGTESIVTYTCASPINDKYGSEEVQLKEPTCIFATEMLGSGICITEKAKNKDLKVLCEFLDYLYTEEGLMLANGGLNKEQAEQANDPTYSTYRRFIPFDPAVINDDGTIRLYYGAWFPFEDSRTSENGDALDVAQQQIFGKTLEEIKGEPGGVGPVTVELADDMLTVISEPKRIMPSNVKGTAWEEHPFFEGSSIRKIGGLYYFIYSSWNNHELCYATSERPDEGFVFRGVIVSNGDIGLNGRTMEDKLNATGNTHGSIENIGGQWYVFYHRQTHGTDFSRQACAEPIEILSDGSIPQAEMTSCGLNGGPLEASGTYPAAICCNLTHGRMPHSGTVKDGNAPASFPFISSEGDELFVRGIENNTWIGYKYFDYPGLRSLELTYRGNGAGSLTVSTRLGGKTLAEIKLEPSPEWKSVRADVPFPAGKTGLFLHYEGAGMIDLLSFTLGETEG